MEVAAQLVQPGMHRMDMGIPEARDHRPPATFDDPGPWADEGPDRGIGADGHDPAVADGQRARPASRRIHRRDARRRR